jgi:hypothetical protein
VTYKNSLINRYLALFPQPPEYEELIRQAFEEKTEAELIQIVNESYDLKKQYKKSVKKKPTFK